MNAKIALLVASAIGATAALPLIANAGPAAVPSYTHEKCFGVAAKGANDCGTASHSCAGESAKASDGQSWIYVPTGTCQKIQGGSLTAKGA
jgi:uncharacterized membrane protein